MLVALSSIGEVRRNHPHYFAYRSYVRERWGEHVLPQGHTLADWPVSYADLEPLLHAPGIRDWHHQR